MEHCVTTRVMLDHSVFHAMFQADRMLTVFHYTVFHYTVLHYTVFRYFVRPRSIQRPGYES